MMQQPGTPMPPQANQQWMMMQQPPPQQPVYQPVQQQQALPMQPQPIQQQSLQQVPMQQSPMQQYPVQQQQPPPMQQTMQPPVQQLPMQQQQQPMMQAPPMQQQQYMSQPLQQPIVQAPPQQPPMQQQPMQQQPMPAQQQQYQFQPASQSYDEIRTLWIGDLQYWMDENYIRNCFTGSAEGIVSVKVIRNRQTMMSEGYGFIEFQSHAVAETVLQTFNGSIMPQTEQAFRLNWATYGASEKRAADGASDHSIFVGDLAPDVTDYMLLETFRTRYPSVKGAKVVMDTITGRSKGYGFVRFGDDNEKASAMNEMNGVYCSNRPMRISIATPKKGLGATQQFNQRGGGAYQAQGFASDSDQNNTTIFVGGLDSSASDEDLRRAFSQFGELVYVKIPVGKNCGFVQFTQRSCAEEALQKLHGQTIGSCTVRLSWGRPLGSKMGQQGGNWGAQMQADPNQWNGGGGYYGFAQGYDGYGYVQAAQDPAAAYAYGGYASYGNYPQQG